MKLNELGFDFSNASNFVMRRKSRLFSMISAILALIMFFLLVVFLILYVLRVPIENNNVVVEYGDPAYNRTFFILLGIFGSMFGLCFILFLTSIIIKPKPFILKSQDSNLNHFYYIYDRSNEIYLSDDRLIIFNRKYNRVSDESFPDKVEKAFDRYIFWHDFAKLDQYQVKRTDKKTILRYRKKIGRIVYRCTYKFEISQQLLPHRVTEFINVTNYGNNRTSKYNVYYIEDVNRMKDIQIPREIQQELIK